jgi:hypothetical protein
MLPGEAGINVRKTARYASKDCDPLHYRGEALWIGCRTGVELPVAVKETLRSEMRTADEALLRPTCPWAEDSSCEFSWGEIKAAHISWTFGRRSRAVDVTMRELPKIEFVRRRAIEY